VLLQEIELSLKLEVLTFFHGLDHNPMLR
jgi:hypothetical protein